MPYWSQKFKNLKFELGEKLDHLYEVKFHGESNGDSLEALKRYIDPKIGHRSLVYGQTSINSKFRLGKVRLPFSRKKFAENRMKIALKPKTMIKPRNGS